jgi:S-methylmethionine-dependent homocysteine/selenocysteine methylase
MSLRESPPFGDGALWLTDAGMETVLIFLLGQDLPSFATFPLLESDTGRAALRAYYEPFFELARARGLGFVLGAGTWRASADWGAELGYDEAAMAAVNRRAIAFVEELRASLPATQPPVLLEAPIGPRGDAYAPSALMTAAEAQRYHATQLQTLADTPVELLTALTLTYAEEAIGIVRAAGDAGLPIAISFTVETDGRLPSGQSLRAAIEQVDAETDGAPLHYMINCAHPAHFTDALMEDGPWRRLRGLRANSSLRSHAELDDADELDEGDPDDLAERHLRLRALLPDLAVLGGCCGTDIRHVTRMADAWLS